MKVFLGFVLGVVVVFVAGIAFIYSGIYNVAAVDAHNPIVIWALDTTMHRSVAVRADAVAAPAQFEQRQVEKGAAHFDKTCVMCHGAPGVEPSQVGKGMRPDPPELAETVRHLETAELFWIVKHGIKMTGMPGFRAAYEDEDLWAIVAFLDRLPTLSPDDYQEMTGQVRSGMQDSGGRAVHNPSQN